MMGTQFTLCQLASLIRGENIAWARKNGADQVRGREGGREGGKEGRREGGWCTIFELQVSLEASRFLCPTDFSNPSLPPSLPSLQMELFGCGRDHTKLEVERLTQRMVLDFYLEEEMVELSSGFPANYVKVRPPSLPPSLLPLPSSLLS
jgi:hypothetical protein